MPNMNSVCNIPILQLTQYCSKEYNLVREHIERAHQLEVEEEAKKSKKFDLSEWHHGKVIVPLFISMALMVFQMWSGFFAIIFRTVDIFAEVKGGPDIEAEISTLIVGIVQFFATFRKTLTYLLIGIKLKLI